MECARDLIRAGKPVVEVWWRSADGKEHLNERLTSEDPEPQTETEN